MNKPAKDNPTSVRLPKETKAALKEIAKKENRALGNLIIKIVQDFIKKYKG